MSTLTQSPFAAVIPRASLFSFTGFSVVGLGENLKFFKSEIIASFAVTMANLWPEKRYKQMNINNDDAEMIATETQ